MALVWQCARCGATDVGSDTQREGLQPPQSWLRIYVPRRNDHGERYARQDVICDVCTEDLAEWFEGVPA